MNSSMHLIYYLCGHLKVVMAHEHENDICPNNLPESETADEDCYHCEGKKKGYEGNPRPIEHEDDFEIIYNDPEDDDDDDGDDDGYDGDDELAYDEGVSPAVAQTRPFDPEDTLENWLDHIRLSAVGECDCVVCESDRAKLKDPQKKLRVVS